MSSHDAAELSEMFSLLTNHHRRQVLYYLTRESERVDVTTLARLIAEWESDDTKSGPSQTTDMIETKLVHIHLPKLAAAGVISYGEQGDTIELETTADFDRYLEASGPADGYPHTLQQN